MKRKTIFEVLFDNQICFSVNVSTTFPKIKGIDMFTRDYFISVHKNDVDKHKLKDFKEYDEYNRVVYPNLYIRDLNETEINEFKENQDKFIKVIHNKDGRVYELKSRSFWSMFKNMQEVQACR